MLSCLDGATMELAKALVEHGVVGEADVQTARARQALYGGHLLTNLLDLGSVSEKAALTVLKTTYGLPTAPPGELPYAAAAAIELVPRDTALSLCIYPFRLDGDRLTLIACQPLGNELERRLSDSFDLRIRVQLALEPRIKQALARDYAHAVEPRMQKALARLEGRSPEPTVPPDQRLVDGPSFSSLPQPPSVAPVGFPRSWRELEPTPTEAQLLAETARAPEVMTNELAYMTGALHRPPMPATAPVVPWRSSGEHAALDGGSLRPRRRGPYTTAEAKRDLRATSDADQMLQIYFHYAAQYFDYSAVFSVQRAGAVLRGARGLAGPATVEPEPILPMDSHPALDAVMRNGRFALESLGEGDPELGRRLGCPTDRQLLVLPVRVGGRVAMLLLGGFDRQDVQLDDVGELLSFETLIAQALQRAILLRKQSGVNDAQSTSADPQYDSTTDAPSLPPVAAKR